MSFEDTSPTAITVHSGGQGTIRFTAKSSNSNSLTVTYKADEGLLLNNASEQERNFALTNQFSPMAATFTFTGAGMHTVNIHAVDSTGSSDDLQATVTLT